MPATSAEPHWPGVSALVVPVPALETWVRDRTTFYDPAYVSADPTFAHAHVTLLSPFVPPSGLTPSVCAQVAELLSMHVPFTVRFEQVEAFPNGVVYLVPEPDAPFRRLTAALGAAFPQFPPYDGQFPHTRPHLTLDRIPAGTPSEPFVAAVRASVADLLPATADAEEARLSWYEQGACRTLATFSLAGRDRPPPRPAGGRGSRRTPAG